MLHFKLLGALLLTVTGGCGAWMLGHRDSIRIDRVEAWIALLRLTKNQIDCFSLPVPEILARCEPSLLTRIGWEGETPPPDFGAITASDAIGMLSMEGRRIACAFSEEIGKGYRQEQLRTCDYSIGLFSAERDRLLSELPKKRKRDTTLCMAAALGTVILLL